MEDVTWVYPRSVEELVECLKNNARPHGGGTGLLRNIPRSGTLADLSGVGIGSIRVDGDTVRIGGGATYTDTVSALNAARPDHIVARALSDAASPALRNRITVGGSLALFPPWSRVAGPLVALDATVSLVGAVSGTYPVSEYVVSQELKERTAVVEVQVDIGRPWESFWYKFAPVRFNYPLLTVAVLIASEGETIADCRIVVTGNSGRFKRLDELEKTVSGKPRVALSAAPAELDTEILGRQGFSAEYLTHVAAVAVTRGLRGPKRSAA